MHGRTLPFPGFCCLGDLRDLRDLRGACRLGNKAATEILALFAVKNQLGWLSLRMKLISLVCLVLVLVWQLARYPLFYWQGYDVNSNCLAYDLCIALFSPILFLVALLTLLASLIRKKHRLWTTCTVLALVGFVALDLKVLPRRAPLVIYGLRDRMLRDYSLDDLRHFARDFHQNLPNVGINHGDISALSENQKKGYSELQEKYPFMKWEIGGRNGAGPSIVEYGNGILYFDWGGPMAGHWGFSVSINGQKNDPAARADPGSFILPQSKDIYFYIGD